jgi:exopolyphosphatase/guanosine-5'-triphosphate,3'-diphosphate pyrophosphatase
VTRRAAVDIGTNSVRLLVADVEGNGRDARVSSVDRRMRITRLGQGVNTARVLAPEAVQRTVAVLEEYGAVLASAGVVHVRATATSAARDAGNREEFFDAAETALGARPELLSGDDEARLSFLGATAELDEATAPAPYLVTDIGGGSTEFAVGTHEPQGQCSVDIGCVRLTEQFLVSDPPTPEELSNALSVARDHLADVERALPGLRDAQTLVGLAGTVSAAAAIEQGLTSYDRDRVHHFRLSKAAAEDVFRTLALEPARQRALNPGLEAERVGVIVGGMIVLVAIMRTFDFEEMLVSEADILDGLVRSIV